MFRKLIAPLTLCCCLWVAGSYAQLPVYAIAERPWVTELGNHRAVIRVQDAQYGIVRVQIPWRRRDADAAQKALVITDSGGRRIQNVYRVRVDREAGDILFAPEHGAGLYYVYYMPYQGTPHIGWWEGNYLRQEPAPDSNWLRRFYRPGAKAMETIPRAQLLTIQSRTASDSFYPMEVCATQAERELLDSAYSAAFLLFPEDRQYPIRMQHDIPYRWITQRPGQHFTGQALRNEYYVFQVGVYAGKTSLKNLQVSFKGTKRVTCFNTGGIDANGEAFTKRVDVPQGDVQALWFGVDIDTQQPAGKLAFEVVIGAENAAPQTVHVELQVASDLLADRGDSEPWRHSRLRWLNSRLGIDDAAVAPYVPLQVKGRSIRSLLHTVQLDEQGLPSVIDANGHALLHQPVRFIVEGTNGPAVFKQSAFTYLQRTPGKIAWVSKGQAGAMAMEINGTMEFDGTLRYTVQLKPGEASQVKDIRLELPMRREAAPLFMGMGLPGGNTPASYSWKWKGPVDSYWMGSVQGGLHCELRGANYAGPLLNLYKPAPPASWYNNDQGGFRLQQDGGATKAIAWSGVRNLARGEVLSFAFDLLITPVKRVNTTDQFISRYYHNGNAPTPAAADLASGIKVTNVHHANPVNPYINYPFIAVDTMRHFVQHMHRLGLKAKIYYTIRELTNQATEIWALRSLGIEVLANGEGGGYPWLREHFGTHYNVQWFTPINGYQASDAAVLTSGESRWYNYYIEGLRWLVQNVDIDGLYLDDVAFDRRMLARMRKVMDRVKPGCLIDLHSNTGFSKGPANQYMEFFPYINKLWFGESFDYNKMSPENWLVEVSGLPFGLMGDMLHAGGNPWRGMLYGMTVRYPWFTEGVSCDPRAIWKVWDDFGIDKARMIGYWDKACPVRTSDSNVRATVYLNKGKALVAIASWAPGNVEVKLLIDWMAIGLDPQRVSFIVPEIARFQQGGTLKADELISVTPGKGALIIIE